MDEATGLGHRQEHCHSPSTPKVTPLRQRMLDDIRMRKLGGHTQAAYVPTPSAIGGQDAAFAKPTTAFRH